MCEWPIRQLLGDADILPFGLEKDVREAKNNIKAMGDATLSAEAAYDGKELMI